MGRADFPYLVFLKRAGSGKTHYHNKKSVDFCDRTAYNISERRNLLDLSALLL